MHVREIPRLVFDKLVDLPQEVNVREFARQNPELLKGSPFDYTIFPNEDRILGAAQGFWLILRDSKDTTDLTVFDSRPGAILYRYESEAHGRLIGGRYNTGHGKFGQGRQFEETVWAQTNKLSFFGSEEIVCCFHGLNLLGQIAVMGREYLDSGAFETSTLFEAETDITRFIER